MTSKAQRAAQARYDVKRPAPVPVRLTEQQLAALAAGTKPGERRQHALLRLGPELLRLAEGGI